MVRRVQNLRVTKITMERNTDRSENFRRANALSTRTHTRTQDFEHSAYNLYFMHNIEMQPCPFISLSIWTIRY